MPRVTRSCQKEIEFPRRKTRSRATKDNEKQTSPAKQTCSFSPRKRRDPNKEEGTICSTSRPFSPKKRKNNQGQGEDVVSSDTENCQPKEMLSLARQDGRQYSVVRKVLHSSYPDNLLCREKEMADIKVFLQNHLPQGKPGSLYISGAPGTGKTACLTKIMVDLRAEIRKCQVIFVNCMALQQPQAIFRKIAVELVGESKCPTKATQKFLEETFSSSKQTRILILDEMDQLESKNQEILYKMFEWPSLPQSKLILIGIANALDLTDRILPRLQARPKCKPELLHFAPYTKEQIVKILQERLSGVEEANNILDSAAIQFCARKVSAVAGDMRKALDICRRAVEVLESRERKQQILQPLQKVTGESPTKQVGTPFKPKKVGISQIASVVADVYGSRMVVGPGKEQPTIPLQQKLLICTFLLMTKEKKTKEVPLGKFHDTYCKICNKRKVSQLGQEDFIGLCNILETRGLMGVKRAKDNRLMKVTLKIDEKEVDYALQDKILLSSILQEGI